MITLQHYTVLSVILFAIGAIGAVVRDNAMAIVFSIGVMFLAACMAMMSFARWNLLPEGSILVMIVMFVAAGLSMLGTAMFVNVKPRGEKGS